MKIPDASLEGDPAIVLADLDAHKGLERLLSVGERVRADRFRWRIHRDRYVAGRGLLRLLLADFLDRNPIAIQITTNAHGKPMLSDGGVLRFNVAHSGSRAIYAFTCTGEIGVDIEQVRPLDPITLSRTCFSDGEQAQLVDVEVPKRLGAFFDGWVRKEAVVKADGRGLLLELRSFTVTLNGAPRVAEPPDGGASDRWSLMEIDAGPDIRAALAVRSQSGPQDGNA